MKFRAALLAATALAVAPAAFAQTAKPAMPAAAATPAAPVKDYVILKVGSEDIKYSEVQDIWKNIFPGGNAPDFNSFDDNVRQNVLRGIVAERLIYQQAVKDGVESSAEVQKKLADLKRKVILQVFMEQKAKTLVTDDELHKIYDAKAAANKGKTEVRARHILVPTEAEAKTVEKELKKGGDFEKIAKEKSTDKGSGAQGGELGWFTQDKMVPEFAAAAFKMKKGDVSDPVKTSFGWHVIQVEDTRPVQMPSFEESKEGLRAEAGEKVMQEYVQGVMKTASVKYYTPDGTEKPFSTELTPPAKAGAAPAGKQ